MAETKKLREIAKVIRSKNSGPFEITFDVIFANPADYERVKATGIITKELVAGLYSVSVDQVLTFGYFDRINAIKATIPRPRAQGSVGETDMHACQQHMPLAGIAIPWLVDV
jgi:hypothetical protein